MRTLTPKVDRCNTSYKVLCGQEKLVMPILLHIRAGMSRPPEIEAQATILVYAVNCCAGRASSRVFNSETLRLCNKKATTEYTVFARIMLHTTP